MKIFFSGCARDCADVLKDNILSLLSIGELEPSIEIRLFIVENDSKDHTREIINEIASVDRRLFPIFLSSLDVKIPVREARIGFCRERLLQEIMEYSNEGLYVPVDLDSSIAKSIKPFEFLSACKIVSSDVCNGVFPISSPYYYDIHALRESTWCPKSCWQEIKRFGAAGSLLPLLAFSVFVAAKQKPQSYFQDRSLIPVKSAFGGIGIYQLREVRKAVASYILSEDDLRSSLSEHVVFNKYLEKLYIAPQWSVSAPAEHIHFRGLPFRDKVGCLVRAGMLDAVRLIPFIQKRLRNR